MGTFRLSARNTVSIEDNAQVQEAPRPEDLLHQDLVYLRAFASKGTDTALGLITKAAQDILVIKPANEIQATGLAIVRVALLNALSALVEENLDQVSVEANLVHNIPGFFSRFKEQRHAEPGWFLKAQWVSYQEAAESRFVEAHRPAIEQLKKLVTGAA